jgi:hypothetical protein
MHDVAGVVIKKLTTRDRTYKPGNWNYAHAAGATCARELGYRRLHPELELAPDPGLMLIFAHGHWVEKEAIDQLEKAGYEVSERDAAFEWPAMRLRGRVDGKIRMEGEKKPVEVKGYHPNIWQKLNSIEDFLTSDREYLRRVPGQLLAYILCDSAGKVDEAFLYLVNKLTGQPKTIWMKLEGKVLEWGEAMLKRLEIVNKAVEKNELPERIEFDENVCGNCPFRGACLKDIPAQLGPVMLTPERETELLALLRELEDLKEAKKRHEDLDDQVKEIVKGIPKLIVGEYLVSGKEIDAKAYAVAARKYWRKTVTNLTKATKADE